MIESHKLCLLQNYETVKKVVLPISFVLSQPSYQAKWKSRCVFFSQDHVAYSRNQLFLHYNLWLHEQVS